MKFEKVQDLKRELLIGTTNKKSEQVWLKELPLVRSVENKNNKLIDDVERVKRKKKQVNEFIDKFD